MNEVMVEVMVGVGKGECWESDRKLILIEIQRRGKSGRRSDKFSFELRIKVKHGRMSEFYTWI